MTSRANSEKYRRIADSGAKEDGKYATWWRRRYVTWLPGPDHWNVAIGRFGGIMTIDKSLEQGMALLGVGRLGDAIPFLLRAAVLSPSAADAWQALGTTAHQQDKVDFAVACLTRAVLLDDRQPAALVNLGIALKKAGHLDGAIAMARQALRLDAGLAEAHSNLANALKERARFALAGDHGQRAVVLRPDFANAYNNLGNLRLAEGQLAGACSLCWQALRISPSHAEAANNLGLSLQEKGQTEQASAVFHRSLCLQPAACSALNNLGFAGIALGTVNAAMACFQRALACHPDFFAAALNRSLASVYREDLDSASLTRLQQDCGAILAKGVNPVAPARPRTETDNRLRIGYVSADLRQHPVGESMLEVFRQHDRRQFRIHVYAQNFRPDKITADCKIAVDGWTDINGLSDLEAAELMGQDGSDILVFLASRFDGNRPRIAAWHPAPVQISLHDVASSGMAAIDYIIADRWLIPGHGREYFSERRLRLPHFYLSPWPETLPDIAVTTGSESMVFGCFNNPTKISDGLLAIWGQILTAVPDSRLVLKYFNRYENMAVRRRIEAGLVRAGASARQLDFAGGGESRTALFSRCNQIDLALDTWPFSGSTTTFQALCMGLPVVTWPWDRMVSRWTAAMLVRVGLSELIARSPHDYLSTALAVAEDRAGWRQRRPLIRQQARQAFTDARTWTHHLERLYRTVAAKHGLGRQ